MAEEKITASDPVLTGLWAGDQLVWAPWALIATAPKDGRWLWGFTPEYSDVGCPNQQPVRWLDESPHFHNGVTVREAGWYGDGFDRDRPVNPTHWKPLAEPPQD